MLPVPHQPTPMMFQNPPLLEGERGEAMTAPIKRRDQANLPCTQMNAIPDELGEYIARIAQMMRDLGW